MNYSYIRPIDTAIREARQRATDAEWDGLDASHLWRYHSRLVEAAKEGEKYEVLF